MKGRSLLAVVLSGSLLLPAPVCSQTGQALAPQPPGTFKINVLQGEGSRNNIRSRTATQPVVEVRDEQDRPVADAEVVFQLPAAGPGGVFHGWMRTQTVKTGVNGQAAASGLTPNEEEGRFNIKVTASDGKRSGSVVISQINLRGNGAAAGSGGARSNWKILAAVGVAALVAGIAVAATRDGGNGPAITTPQPVVITPGVVTVAGPR